MSYTKNGRKKKESYNTGGGSRFPSLFFSFYHLLFFLSVDTIFVRIKTLKWSSQFSKRIKKISNSDLLVVQKKSTTRVYYGVFHSDVSPTMIRPSYSDSAMVIRPSYSDSAMAIQPSYSDSAMMIRPSYSDSAMVIRPPYSDSVMVIQPSYSDSAMVIRPSYSDSVRFCQGPSTI